MKLHRLAPIAAALGLASLATNALAADSVKVGLIGT